MKNFWRRMAAREGFTLVELVVVIAILAILAAVAYPAYTGYITKAHEAADVTQLDAIATAAQAAAAEDGSLYSIEVEVTATSGAISEVTIKAGDAGATSVDGGPDSLFAQLLGKKPTTITFTSDTYKAGGTIKWIAGKWTGPTT